MSLGFSVYFGLDNTKDENIQLLKDAYELGFTRIFTSLHIPEANYEILKVEVRDFFKIAKKYDMDIISDISPNTFKFLDLENVDLKGLRDMGVKTIRIDFGYIEEEIAIMSKNNYGIQIQLNASTISADFFENLDKFSPNYKNIDALHNFYPRVGTGISEECMIEKNKILSGKGIKACAFVQSNNRKRSPLKDGLPTLEDHRNKEVRQAANHLFAIGNKSVFIGDSLPSKQELKELSSLFTEGVELRIKVDTKDEVSTNLLDEIYSSRIDEARDAIRASESRLILNEKEIKPENTVNKKYGDVTIDNNGYQRYMGELQILTIDQEKDPRINKVASVLQDDFYLLKYIKDGKKFYFRKV
ncbi:MupG family TIM beta-alpha barrel fold protein [Paraclostridium ghonii]|uniref:MupG family TIM beta-alpha barrel fold protein n=1 Tax=Paraclostridium ghonii TaxID=29358 RepID=UPI00202CC7AF|nr:MupG family TIM beta-alpha barrel fold protein [Paeniclostridium ghonii]MCM0165154.1 MupG family TIM beta-alpha barrel fold protein [Paeniclostridium ghonii]